MMRVLAGVLVLILSWGAATEAVAFGALAAGRAQDGTVYVAILTRPNEQAVSADAQRVCERMVRRRGREPREACRVVRTFTNLCAAAVHDQRQRLFTAFASENYWARVRAQDACRRAQGRNCVVIRSLCDTTLNRPRATAEAGAPLTNPN